MPTKIAIFSGARIIFFIRHPIKSRGTSSKFIARQEQRRPNEILGYLERDEAYAGMSPCQRRINLGFGVKGVPREPKPDRAERR